MSTTTQKQKLLKHTATWKKRRLARHPRVQRQREERFALFFTHVQKLAELYMTLACQHKAPSLFDLLDETGIDFVAVPLEGGAAWRVYAAADFPGCPMASSVGWVQDELLTALQAAPAGGLVASVKWGRLLGLPQAVAELLPSGV